MLSQAVMVGVLTLALQVWILVLMWKKKLIARFPLFFAYILYQIAEGAFRWFVRDKYGVASPAYYYAYWETEVGELLFLLVALGESSWHMFRSFRRLWWFWRLLVLSLAATMAYGIFSAWVSPPRRVMPAMAVVLRLDFIATFIPTGVAILYFGLVFRFRSWRWFARESGIIVGLAMNSLAGLVTAGLRSYFGRASFDITRWIAPLGYILAEILWIREFSQPDPPQLSQEDLAMLRPIMEQVNKALDRYSDALKEVGNSK